MYVFVAALLETVSHNLTAAALDLGGGSTQVTFRPLLTDTIEAAPPNFIKDIKMFGETVRLYTHR